MANEELSKDDLVFGRAVLLATDSLGLSAEGAFWLRSSNNSEWKFFLVTSLISRIGPREIYLRLNDALIKNLSERETRDFVFFIADPNEPIVSAIRDEVGTGRYSSDQQKISSKFDERLAQAHVYRMADPLSGGELKVTQRRFFRISDAVAA
jgi:hypothetical protein